MGADAPSVGQVA